MNWRDELTGENEDRVVAQALRNFKASVQAWSDAAQSDAAMRRPQPAVKVARYGWRVAAGWALGCAVAAVSLTGVLHQREQRQEQARIAAAQAAAQKAAELKLADEELSQSQSDEDLLANVDSDISRAVPAAMEPLAQMMDEKQASNNGTK
jgi:CO/xanthine dehydrogenase FAD-binding subunit